MYAVIANVITDNQLRVGAKVYILFHHGMAESALVYGMSKYGKRIEKYISYKKLERFRGCWVPEHIRPRMHENWMHEERWEADRHADWLNQMWGRVRVFDPQGNLVKDGLSAGEAYRSLMHGRQIKR